jgi:hypothetical protein
VVQIIQDGHRLPPGVSRRIRIAGGLVGIAEVR